MKCVSNTITMALITVLVICPRQSIASPQILGLVATPAVQLNCSGKLCKAVFSSFCLQQHRDIPKPGTRYGLLPNSDVSLIITLKNGDLKIVKAPEFASIKTVRNFSSVSISVPRNLLKFHGGVSAAIRIGSLVSAIPNNSGKGSIAISQSEIKKYTGPVRQLAAQIHHSESLHASIALHINDIINQLNSDKPAKSGDAARLWREIKGKIPNESSNSSLSVAATELFDCESTSLSSAGFGKEHALGFKSCLQSVHEKHMNGFSRQVWQRTGLGS